MQPRRSRKSQFRPGFTKFFYAFSMSALLQIHQSFRQFCATALSHLRRENRENNFRCRYGAQDEWWRYWIHHSLNA